MNRDIGRGAAIAVTVLGAMLTGIQGAGTNLGLNEQQLAWVGIFAGGLAVLNGFLPRVQSSGSGDEQ